MEQAAFAFCPVRGAVRALLSGEKGRGFVRGSPGKGWMRAVGGAFVLPCTNRRNTVGGTQNGNGRKENELTEAALPVQELPADILDEVRQKLAKDLNEEATEDLEARHPGSRERGSPGR